MRYRVNRFISLILCMLLILTSFSGCTQKTTVSTEKKPVKYVVTTAFGNTELMRINDKSVYLPEFYLYLTTVQNQYEAVYGDAIWNMSPDGESLELQIKEMVLAKVAQVTVMNLMAEEDGVTLNADEEAKVNEASTNFYSSLTEAEINALDINEDVVKNAYRKYALAEKFYKDAISNVSTEVSDDEARKVTVMAIMFKTYTEDAEGKKTKFSERALMETLDKAKKVREQAISGEVDFESLALTYSNEDVITYSFGRGESSSIVEEAVFSLGNGDISEIVETDYGYSIFKCVSNFDIEETALNKAAIIEARKSKAFGDKYESFLKVITKSLNKKLYDSIGLIKDENVTTSSFFSVDF